MFSIPVYPTLRVAEGFFWATFQILIAAILLLDVINPPGMFLTQAIVRRSIFYFSKVCISLKLELSNKDISPPSQQTRR
jgi:hypothetical protein